MLSIMFLRVVFSLNPETSPSSPVDQMSRKSSASSPVPLPPSSPAPQALQQVPISHLQFQGWHIGSAETDTTTAKGSATGSASAGTSASGSAASAASSTAKASSGQTTYGSRGFAVAVGMIGVVIVGMFVVA